MAHQYGPLGATLVGQSADFMTRIYQYALQGQDANNRQQLRYAFASRCKMYNRIALANFDYFDVFGTEGVEKALERLTNPDYADRVTRMYLQLASPRGKNKETKFRDLMHRVANLVEFEFVVSAKNLDTLEKSLVSALRGLSKMESLVIRPYRNRDLPLLDSSILGVVAPHWSELRTMTLKCNIAWPRTRDTDLEGLFKSLRRLHTLSYHTISTDPDRLLTAPPPSLRTLTLSHPDTYIQDTLPPDLFNALAFFSVDSEDDDDDDAPREFKMKARHITALSLCDPPNPGTTDLPVRTRGRFYDVLKSLVDLRSLACAPCAVESLVMLALLPSLRELSLVEDRARLTPPIKAGELMDLISQGTLAKVSVGASIKRNWSGIDQARVESLGLQQGCEVVWL